MSLGSAKLHGAELLHLSQSPAELSWKAHPDLRDLGGNKFPRTSLRPATLQPPAPFHNMALSVSEIARTRAFDCSVLRFSHVSPTLGGLETKWAAIVPDAAATAPLPVLYWYSGLTCNDENFTQKAGAAAAAAAHRVIVSVAPPRSGPIASAAR